MPEQIRLSKNYAVSRVDTLLRSGKTKTARRAFMISDLELDDFLSRNRISNETWGLAGIEWTTLKSIGIDHESKTDYLGETAEFIAGGMQKFKRVHSVRWRVKDAEHLMQKIVRKLADPESREKYKDIGTENYRTIITDLIGVRALHLFKDDFIKVHEEIAGTWNFEETPKIYIRSGDQEPQVDSKEFSSQIHPKGYRSVHYIISTQPKKEKILIEVQVRTIFEEGWSEIDHQIRYPNFSDNALIEYYLQTFNRISGSADEMGSFVKILATDIKLKQDQMESLSAERDQALNEMERTINSMQEAKNQGAQLTENINQLKEEVNRLRGNLSKQNPWDFYSEELQKIIESSKTGYAWNDKWKEILDVKIATLPMPEINIQGLLTPSPKTKATPKPKTPGRKAEDGEEVS